MGIDSGDIVFDGSRSYDPDDKSASLTFEWSCQKITDQVHLSLLTPSSQCCQSLIHFVPV